MLRIVILVGVSALLALADGPVLKTGQTASYDTSGNIVTDGSLRDDGYYQAGVARSYSRSNDVVTDEATDLQWQDNESAKKPWITQENYDAGDYNNTSGDTATTYCSNLTLDGGGWRLPGIAELEMLTESGLDIHRPINPIFQAIRGYISFFYWSSNTYIVENTHSGSEAWVISTGSGTSIHKTKHSYGAVRCIRGGELEPSNLSRNDTAEIVTDSTTGLQWQDDSATGSEELGWTEAIDYCENTLALGGYNDWRLPNRNELHSIINRTQYPAVNNLVFKNIPLSSLSSSSESASKWCIGLYSGITVREGVGRALCVRGKTPDVVTPAAPADITASNGTSTSNVTIGNYSVNGATYYKIYRALSSTGTKYYLDSTDAATYEDTRAEPYKTYYYFVKACNSYKYSNYSVGNSGWLKPTVPTSPANIDASDTWTSNITIRNYSVNGATQYDIARAATPTGYKTYIARTSASSYADKTAVAGKTYYYFVKALNSAGASNYSASDAGMRVVISAPTGITASDGNFVSNVSIGSYGVSGATHYKIYRSNSSTSYISYLGLTYGVGYQDKTAVAENKYYYYVKSCNSKGCSNYSNGNSGWRSDGLPKVPTDITASNGDWVSNVSIGSYGVSGATHYKIYRADSPTGNITYLGLTYGVGYQDKTAVPAQTYYYSVKACNNMGCTVYSDYNTGWRSL